MAVKASRPLRTSLGEAFQYALASFAPEHKMRNILNFRLSTLLKAIAADPRSAEICSDLDQLMQIAELDNKEDVEGSKC